MKREIEFRAWDEQNKVMHNNFQFIKSGDSGNDWIIFISDKYTLDNYETNPFTNPNPYFSQQLKVMQWTGLKDKNGVKIFEGDIVKNVIFNDGSEYENNQEVYYEGGAFSIGMSYLCLTKSVEVIGNIYQNPELLKVVK